MIKEDSGIPLTVMGIRVAVGKGVGDGVGVIVGRGVGSLLVVGIGVGLAGGGGCDAVGKVVVGGGDTVSEVEAGSGSATTLFPLLSEFTWSPISSAGFELELPGLQATSSMNIQKKSTLPG